MDDYSWIHDFGAVDMDELSSLYRIAPLGDKPPEALATVFGNSWSAGLSAFSGHGRIPPFPERHRQCERHDDGDRQRRTRKAITSSP